MFGIDSAIKPIKASKEAYTSKDLYFPLQRINMSSCEELMKFWIVNPIVFHSIEFKYINTYNDINKDNIK